MDEKTLAELGALVPQFKAKMEQWTSEAKMFGSANDKTTAEMKELREQVDALEKKLAGNVFSDKAHNEKRLQEVKGDRYLQELFRTGKGRAQITLDAYQHAALLNRKAQFPGMLEPTDRKKQAFMDASAKGTGADIEMKTVITDAAVGTATSGVLLFDRQAGITREARETLTIRDLFQAKPTANRLVDWIKINQPVSIASPVAELGTKPESQLTFTTVSEPVRLLAVIIRASRQVLDDFDVLMSEINDQMSFYTKLAEEQGFLSGDGTGENLHGLIPQATAFQTSLLSASKGWTKIDIVRRVIEQIRNAKELPPTFIIMNPVDVADVQLTKDSFGRYIMGDPDKGPGQITTIWGLTIVETTTMPVGSFLVGSGNPAAAGIRDRMGMVIDISTEDGNNFALNQVTIRCELRTLLMCRRPASFVTGSWSTSPA